MSPISDQSEKRIVVTGASGFVARHLIALLLRPGQGPRPIRILALVSPEAGLCMPVSSSAVPEFGDDGWRVGSTGQRLEIDTLDIRDAAATESKLKVFEPHEVYHLAARASGRDTERDAIYAVNVAGVRNILDAASSLRPFPRVLLVSSIYVYGETEPGRPAREEDPIGPLWKFGPYADSKMEMETLARGYRGLVVIARSAAHTGPGQRTAYAIPSFARQLARVEAGLEPPNIRVGNLEARRDLLDVRDVVRAYSHLMASGESGAAYNVASGRPRTIGDILERLRSFCPVPTRISADPELMRAGDISFSSGDPALLAKLVGWQPRYDLDSTLLNTLDYWREETKTAQG